MQVAVYSVIIVTSLLGNGAARQRRRYLYRLAREAHAHDDQLLHRQPGRLRSPRDVILYLGTPGRRPDTRLVTGRLLLQIQQLYTR